MKAKLQFTLKKTSSMIFSKSETQLRNQARKHMSAEAIDEMQRNRLGLNTVYTYTGKKDSFVAESTSSGGAGTGSLAEGLAASRKRKSSTSEGNSERILIFRIDI